MRRITFVSSLILLILVCSSNVFSQGVTDNLSLSISVDSATLVPGQKAKIRIKVENKTGQIIKADTVTIFFNLSNQGKNLDRCTISDCFIATIVGLSRKLRVGETSEIIGDLETLFWVPLISSIIGAPEPGNIFKEIPPGNYYLFVELVKYSSPKDPKKIGATSNAILINIAGK